MLPALEERALQSEKAHEEAVAVCSADSWACNLRLPVTLREEASDACNQRAHWGAKWPILFCAERNASAINLQREALGCDACRNESKWYNAMKRGSYLPEVTEKLLLTAKREVTWSVKLTVQSLTRERRQRKWYELRERLFHDYRGCKHNPWLSLMAEERKHYISA